MAALQEAGIWDKDGKVGKSITDIFSKIYFKFPIRFCITMNNPENFTVMKTKIKKVLLDSSNFKNEFKFVNEK